MTEHIAVFPDNIAPGAEHRYLRLPHPRTGQPQLYLPYSTGRGGLCEAIKVSGARGRTWFVGEDNIAEGTLLMHNPIDPLFLAIPVALSLIPASATTPAQFQPLPDLLSTAAASASFALRPAFSPAAPVEAWNADMSQLVEMKCWRRAFRACCEKKVVESTDGAKATYYRPSRSGILALLKQKVSVLVSPREFAKFDHLLRSLGRDGLLPTSTTATSPIDEAIVAAARSRAAVEQIAAYLPPALLASLVAEYDFAALDAYLQDRAAAAIAASMPVGKENKKGEKGGEVKGDGKKRKAGGAAPSRGVEALKKVKTEGMAKMTSFFKPKAK